MRLRITTMVALVVIVVVAGFYLLRDDNSIEECDFDEVLQHETNECVPCGREDATPENPCRGRRGSEL